MSMEPQPAPLSIAPSAMKSFVSLPRPQKPNFCNRISVNGMHCQLRGRGRGRA